MTPAEFDRAIDKGDVPSLLLFYGEERFLIDKAVSRVRDIVVSPEARDFNYDVFYGKEVSAQSLLDAVRTFPAFAPRRMVLVKDAHDITAAELDSLRAYLKDPVEETVLLLVAEKVDLRRGFFQDLRKNGTIVEFKKLYENQIPSFVKEMVRSAQRSLTEDAMSLFCRRVGTNLQEIHGELEKLFSYVGEKNLIDVDDVSAVVSDTKVDTIFDLTNALGKKETGNALRLLSRLRQDGVAPLLILNMMTRHFRQLWKIKELQRHGEGKKEIAQVIRVNPYFVDGLIRQAGMFDVTLYRKAFHLFLNADIDLKSSGGHPDAILEGLVYAICSGSLK